MDEGIVGGRGDPLATRELSATIFGIGGMYVAKGWRGEFGVEAGSGADRRFKGFKIKAKTPSL